MTHFYVFECKSVQAYIFSSSRLIDMISASERLDRLIDTDNESILARVIAQLGIQTDLHHVDTDVGDEGIQFLRCKGGALQAFSESLESLISFRSLWQLTVRELFPSLSFVDALVSADNLPEAIQNGFTQLREAQNLPTLNRNEATAVMQRYPRTGRASVPLSAAAKKNQGETWKAADLDINYHRSAYTTWNLKDNSRLKQRFINTDTRIPANHDENLATGEVKDVALVHVDGNGLGQLLMNLRNSLDGNDQKTSKRVLRAFSDVINAATVTAAKAATTWLSEQYDEKLSNGYLLMRPIVLGGDDVTVLIVARYAIGYLEEFTQAFQQATERAISSLIQEFDLPAGHFAPYLTASGGIVFCKLSHPFMAVAALAEEATASAKALSKSVIPQSGIAPASVTFCRTSTVVTNDFESYLDQVSAFNQTSNSFGVVRVELSQPGYRLNGSGITLENLKELALFCRDESSNSPMSMAKWRQMETHLSAGDFDAAQRLFDRACELNRGGVEKLKELTTRVLSGCSGKFFDWYAKTEDGTAQSFIHDLLVLDHFQNKTEQQVDSEKSKESA